MGQLQEKPMKKLIAFGCGWSPPAACSPLSNHPLYRSGIDRASSSNANTERTKLMKTWIIRIALVGGLLAAQVTPASAQDARFFRIAGPVANTITAFSADGYITWTNAPTNATFTVQTAASLVNPINWVDYIQVPATNPVTTLWLYDPSPPSGMALIPAGSFTMGATTNMGHEGYSDEVPQHSVYVSAFYMDRYEVTKALWDEVYQWATNRPMEVRYSFDYADSGQGKANEHPAHTMTWYDAVKWCNARSEKEGRTPAYYTDAGLSVRYRSGQVNVQTNWVNWSSGYRLPTEAEWEKAARGGASGHRFPWANVDTITHSQANYYSSSSYAYDISPTRGYHQTFTNGVTPYTSPVGYFAPNGYGLYDMSGNVWEWCWDWYSSTYYSSSPGTDPRGPAPGSARVLRGGCWDSHAFHCRSANRASRNPTYRATYVGFRSVLPSGQP
jgi:formylglycine-generating enzyme required for sulfatase activity